MKFKSIKSLAVAAVLLIGPAGYGQSLGEIARQNREVKETEKENADANSTTQPKVITNNDLATDVPNRPVSFGPQPVDSAMKTPSTAEQSASEYRAEQRAAQTRNQQRIDQQRISQQRAAEQWKRQIVAQKRKLANLQARVDQLSASIQAANGTTQYEGPNGRAQARQLQRVAEVQLRLDEQRRALVDMQEAARHAGMHTAVYDP
jgi:hypothetical protein